jgi:hypothetical protein
MSEDVITLKVKFEFAFEQQELTPALCHRINRLMRFSENDPAGEVSLDPCLVADLVDALEQVEHTYIRARAVQRAQTDRQRKGKP